MPGPVTFEALARFFRGLTGTNFAFSERSADPTGSELIAGMVWHNTTTSKWKGYDGSSVITFGEELATTLDFGSWTATVSSQVNTANAALSGTYQRVGSIVTCRVNFSCNPSVGGDTDTNFKFSLPIDPVSIFSNFKDLTGPATFFYGVFASEILAAEIQTLSGTKTGLVRLFSQSTALHTGYGVFQYEI